MVRVGPNPLLCSFPIYFLPVTCSIPYSYRPSLTSPSPSLLLHILPPSTYIAQALLLIIQPM